MNEEIAIIGSIVGVAGALSSLLLSILGFVRSGRAERLAEATRLNEQVRLEATKAGTLVLKPIGEFILSLSTHVWLRKMEAPAEELNDAFQRAGKAKGEVAKLLYQYSIFLSDDIIESLRKLVHLELKDVPRLEEFVQYAEATHLRVVHMFRDTYVSSANQPTVALSRTGAA